MEQMFTFDVRQPHAIGTREEFEAYRAWAHAQVCSGCDTPGCGPGCGKPATEASPAEPWVTEVCCWRCHFHRPYRSP